MTAPDRDGWERLLGQLDDPPLGTVAEALADARDLDVLDAYDVVEEAIDEGVLVEEDTGAAFGAVRLPEDAEPPETAGSSVENLPQTETADMEPRGADTEADDPEGEDAETPLDDGRAAVEGEAYPETITEREYWVNWILDGYGRKRPVAPWKTGHAYPVEWNGDLPEEERPEADFSTAKRWADFDLADADLQLPDDAQSDGLDTGLLLPNERPDREECITLIDWDDVRDPETEEIHPAAAEYIRQFGGYVEVSTSGEGLHQFVLGGLRKRGKFIAPIDEEPFIGEDLPQVEIYDGGRHVAMTGRHVEGSDDDVLPDGQPLIDDLVTEYAEAEKDAGHRRYDPETGEADGDADGSADHVPEPKTGEYNGPTAEELRETKPDDRSLVYHAVVETFYRGGGNSGGYAHIQNWRLEGFAAALGERDDLGAEAVKEDLGGRYLGETDVPKGCEHRTPERVDYGYNRARTGKLEAPSAATLVEYGVLPPTLVEADTNPVAALPLAQLDALDAEEARRYASKRGVEWPTTREARERLRSDIFETMHHGDVRLHDAPTALGKSYTVATEPWRRRADTTGEQPVVHLSETREARDQAAEGSEEAGVEYAKLLGRTEACPVAAGAHDPGEDADDDPDTVITMEGTPASEWFENVCEGRGLPFSVAHKHLDEHNDQGADLPCTHEGECESIAQWDGLPRNDDGDAAVDVIHATHAFAHVPSIRNATNVIFDERPAFKTDLGHGRVRKAVAAFLQASGAPVSTFEGLVSRAKNPDSTPNEHAEHAYVSDALEYEPDREWYMTADGAHTLAPALTRAIYYALRPDEGEETAQDQNGRYSATVPHQPPRLDAEAGDGDGWNRTWVSVVLDEENTIRGVRTSPDMSAARSVVALDAHPSVTLWQRNVHPDIRPEPVLDPTERALWRRYERGLITVGVGDATRPLTSGEYFDEDGTRAFFEALRERYGDRFRTAITAASVEHDTHTLLEEVGVDDPDTMHYGEEKSRGDFGDEDIGVLNGCIDPGDDYVLDLLAEAGLQATPETTEGEDGDEHRAHGRGFEGPDADLAADLLGSVREQHVAQGAGRYARNADDPDDSAIVFVRTDAAPVGFLDITVPGVEWLATDTQESIVGALRERPHATAKELAEDVDATKEHVRKTLQRLQDRGVVSVREGAGAHGAHLYRALAGLGGVDDVRLEPEEQTTNDPVCSTYTWALAIAPADEAYTTRPSVSGGVEGGPAGGDDADRLGVTADDTDDPPS